MDDVLIVGAGISGLATAWFLKARGRRVRVLEAAGAPGGCLRTTADGGFLVEAGPNSTLFRNGALGELLQALGLGSEALEANRLAKRRYIVKDGELVPLPGGAAAFLKTPLFSAGAKARLLLEPFHRRARFEESVAAFVRRRLGPEFLDWAIDPFVSGVYAGDPERLSVRAATAKIYALEAEYGSLFIGAMARALRGRASGPQPVGKLLSFRGGMQALPRALTEKLDGAVEFSQEVTALARGSRGGWRVRTGNGDHHAERLILALPAYRAAALLSPVDGVLAGELERIVYPPVASIALGFERGQVAHPLDGFGMLVPRRVGRAILGALFSSTLFPGRAPDGQVLLTAFMGGARDPSITDLDESALVRRALVDLRALLGITGEPLFQRLTVWERAIPQYEIGHLERLARIDVRLAALPGLSLRANWRDGISVSDCVAAAKATAGAIGAA